jgi:uncharacterized membrane-anchored protein YjiN (DUF445 family)
LEEWRHPLRRKKVVERKAQGPTSKGSLTKPCRRRTEHDRLGQTVAQGLADRIQRLKDASISAIIKKAESEKKRPDLTALLDIIQLANADKLVDVMTDDLAGFLGQLLRDANIVQESILLGPIVEQIGAIEELAVFLRAAKLHGIRKSGAPSGRFAYGVEGI